MMKIIFSTNIELLVASDAAALTLPTPQAGIRLGAQLPAKVFQPHRRSDTRSCFLTLFMYEHDNHIKKKTFLIDWDEGER